MSFMEFAYMAGLAISIPLTIWSIWKINVYAHLINKHKAQIKNGYYPQVEIDRMIDDFIEEFKEENADAIMYMQMADGIKSGAVNVVGVEIDDSESTKGLVMLSQEEYERLDQCDRLVVSMNEAQKKRKVVEKAS